VSRRAGAFLVSDVAGWRADQAADGVPFLNPLMSMRTMFPFVPRSIPTAHLNRLQKAA
jgi:hypothetical protein